MSLIQLLIYIKFFPNIKYFFLFSNMEPNHYDSFKEIENKTDRKLASVQKIISIDPIPATDNLLVAQVLGWKVVIKKQDNFSIGDKIIYIEIDSLLPAKEWRE